MVDTGAAPNILKQRSLHPENVINSQDILTLSGISKHNIPTLGSVTINYMEHAVTLHIVDDNFPIIQEGILGRDFLRDAKLIELEEGHILWRGIPIPLIQCDSLIILARSRAVIPIRITNVYVTEGYVPRVKIDENLYLGEAIVTNRKSIAYIGIVNTDNENRVLRIPTVEIEEIGKISSHEPQSQESGIRELEYEGSLLLDSNKRGTAALGHEPPNLSPTARVSLVTTSAQTDRVQILQESLRMGHLNKEGKEHVQKLLRDHHDIFRLPNDNLKCTGNIAHKINTTDDTPINTKQYRYPPIHKEEINKQINELLDNSIIEPSISPYNSPLWIVPKKPD